MPSERQRQAFHEAGIMKRLGLTTTSSFFTFPEKQPALITMLLLVTDCSPNPQLL